MADTRPTPRTIPAPLAVLIAAVALVAGFFLGRAFGGSDDAGPGISIPVPSGTGSAAASTGPSAVSPTSPEGTPSVSLGQATMSLSGGINADISFGRLATPAEWAPPPGTIALTWNGPGGQALSLDGPSFTSQIVTDAAHALSFTVNVDGSPITYTSAAGECTVTISPALPTQMGGTFFCTNLPGTDGQPIVNAQGSFSATG